MGSFHLSTQQIFVRFLLVMDMAWDAGAIRRLRTQPALQRLTGAPAGGWVPLEEERRRIPQRRVAANGDSDINE